MGGNLDWLEGREKLEEAPEGVPCRCVVVGSETLYLPMTPEEIAERTEDEEAHAQERAAMEAAHVADEAKADAAKKKLAALGLTPEDIRAVLN